MNRILIGITFILIASCSAGLAFPAHGHWDPSSESELNFSETIFLYDLSAMFAIIALFFGYALLEKPKTIPDKEISDFK